MMKILSIETSCDETALALLDAKDGKIPRFTLLQNLVSSQIEVHKPFGGVVPNLAKREHLKNLPLLYKKLKLKSLKLHKIDLITVTVGPGLEPALWTGINFAKELHHDFKIRNAKTKIVGANHLEGHLYSFLLSKKITNYQSPSIFPSISLIVSGGHTILLRMDSLTKWKKLGETRDDAVGEAFDKVARMLSLPYPGGPEIERLAKLGDPHAIEFPRPMIHSKDYDFSFSGLKTSVFYFINRNKASEENLSANISASFQNAAIETLVKKTIRAAKEFNAKSIMLSGGVASNMALHKSLRTESAKLKVRFISSQKKFNTDNAAMIGVAGYMAYLRKKKYPLHANGNLNL